MVAADVLQAAQAAPFLGLLAYMVWDKQQDRRLARERIDADKEQATALTLLATKIDGLR